MNANIEQGITNIEYRSGMQEMRMLNTSLKTICELALKARDIIAQAGAQRRPG